MMRNSNSYDMDSSSYSASHHSDSSSSSSSSSHKSLLAFSLSNNNNNNFNNSSQNPDLAFPNSSSSSNQHHHPSHLSFFQSFIATNTGAPINAQLERQDRDGAPENGFPAHLPVFYGGPKLEDFLGGARTTTTIPPLGGVVFAGLLPTPTLPNAEEIYDSELTSITESIIGNYSGAGNSSEANKVEPQEQQKALLVSEAVGPKKNVETFGQRTSIYRGVTRHRWTGRYEAHLWDNSCRREGQSRKGRQVYLGGYDKEEKAARAYDLAALKYWGSATTINFPISNYEAELEEMKHMTRQEFVASLRRKSSGFSRGASIYRGVTRHHQHGRWQARIGRVAGNKDLYLGTFSTQEEAAEAYDIAAIKFRGLNAVTNFDISRYDVKSIVACCNLPIGGLTSNKSKPSSSDKSVDPMPLVPFNVPALPSPDGRGSIFPAGITIKADPADHYWSNVLGFQTNLKGVTNGEMMRHDLGNPVGFCLDFNNAADVQEGNTHFGSYVGGEGLNGNSTSNNASGIPLASTTLMTPTAISMGDDVNKSSNSNEYGENDNWMNNSVSRPYQTAKSNQSVLQTPIFGIE